MSMLFGLLLLAPVPLAPSLPAQDKRIEKVLASGDGKTRETAYKVGNVGEEYAVLRKLGWQPVEQSLITDGDKAFDLLKATDAATGESHEVWFDISAFFGKEFGF